MRDIVYIMHRKLARHQGKTLRSLFTARQDAIQESLSVPDSLYYPSDLWHVYLKLDFENAYENASNQKDATAFLRNVGKAAQIAEDIFSQIDGALIEAQGSMIHLLLPGNLPKLDLVAICKVLDNRLDNQFNGHDKVNSWRMTADVGKTILVESDGIHDDSSFVSLGKAANRPAKFLYKEKLTKAEESRHLKKRHLGIYNASTGSWDCEDLSILQESFQMHTKAASYSTADLDVTVRGVESMIKQAQAVPIEEGQGAPTNEQPNVYFGWVMRADLDGFTKKVEECHDDDNALMQLAQDFRDLMDKAADFAKKHEEMLIQLPWAGDNFTAVAVYGSKKSYESAAQDKLVNLSLDFDDALHNDATKAGFTGWAQGVAGGDVHGNANGNVFLGSVSIPGRRFLLGAGVGVGRSLQAFIDMDPAQQQFAVWKEDCDNLLKPYKPHLTDDSKADNTSSSLYRKGWQKDLQVAREETAKALAPTLVPAKTAITVEGAKVIATSRPFADE